MADAISIATSIIAFVELAGRIIQLSQFCIDAIKDAPSDIQMILGEVSSIKVIVAGFEEPEEVAKNPPKRLVLHLFAKGGPIDACQRCLSGLLGLLPARTHDDPTAKRRGLSLLDLAWPLKQSKARKLLAEISHHKATLLLAISGDMTNDLRSIQTTLRQLQNTMSGVELTSPLQDSERHAMFQWLEQQNPSVLHNAAFQKHEPHTSAWLLRSPEWQKWLVDSPNDRFLWINGLPGSGKTVLASFIVEMLKQIRGANEGHCLAYYYCHYTHNQDEAAPFLTWTVSQVCRQVKWIPQQLKDLFDQGCAASIPELENILDMILDKVKVLYLVIDAIDESLPRDDLMYLIATMVVDKRFRKIRILATSRQYSDIERLFSSISIAVSMSNSFVDADVRYFVRARLSSSRCLFRWNGMLEEIENALVSKANGMFRWADCQIQAIERLRDIYQLRSALNNLPRDISETYVRIFDAIPDTDRAFVRRVLIWVIGHSKSPWFADRGINAELLLSAVTYDMYGSLPSTGISVYDCGYLQELCGCLLTFKTAAGEYTRVESTPIRALPCHNSEADHRPMDLESDEQYGPDRSVSEASVFVSLAHYTVMEFIVSPHILQTTVSCFAVPLNVIKSEFAASVLQQALTADPRGTGTDWVYDREAYCLTLGCALDMGDFLLEQPIQDLFLQYLCPSNSHFSRFWPIQQQLVLDREFSESFFLNLLPSHFGETRDGRRDIHAETLLCLLMVPVQPTVEQSLIRKLSMERDTKALLEARVSACFKSRFSRSTDDVSELGLTRQEGAVWELRNWNTRQTTSIYNEQDIINSAHLQFASM